MEIPPRKLTAGEPGDEGKMLKVPREEIAEEHWVSKDTRDTPLTPLLPTPEA